MTTAVLVVGSLNQDLIVSAPRAPLVGETLLAHGHSTGFGGKGANQAVAAARLGADVAVLGCVGADEAGSRYLELLDAEGIDRAGVRVSRDSPTGLAVVIVEDDGQNRILVSPGANAQLDVADLDAASQVLHSAAVVLAQLEVPVQVVVEAFRRTTATRILNAAPAADVPQELLDVTDILVVNESELAALVGRPEPADVAEALDGAAQVSGPSTVVVTLGAAGAVVRTSDAGSGHRTWHQPGLVVDAVDTTAAGDAFCGALAMLVGRGATLDVAVARATEVSALVVSRRGALTSLPTLPDLAEHHEGWTS